MDEQIDNALSAMGEQVIEASCVISRYGMAYCLAVAELDTEVAMREAQRFADEYAATLVVAIRKAIADAGPAIAADIMAAEAIAAASSQKH